MKVQRSKDITRVVREDRHAIDESLAKGVRDAMLRHKKDESPVVIECGGSGGS